MSRIWNGIGSFTATTASHRAGSTVPSDSTRHTAKEKLALKRLRKWSDPQAQGNPTQRMAQIWANPIEMARDIHVLLALVGGEGGE